MADPNFLTVHARRRTTDPFAGATVSISFDGGTTFSKAAAMKDGTQTVQIDPAATSIVVRVAPPTKATGKPWQEDDTAFWPVDVPLAYDTTGTAPKLTIAPVPAGKPPRNEANIPASVKPKSTSGSATFDLDVFLARVRDVSDLAVSVYAAGNPTTPVAPSFPMKATHNLDKKTLFAKDTLLAGGKIDRAVATEFPDDADLVRVLEVAAPLAASTGASGASFNPKLVAVYYPSRDSIADTTNPSYLIYFKPDATQMGLGPNDKLDRPTYSKSFNYQWGVMAALYYQGDPWQPTMNWCVGAMQQIMASGKQLGMIMPVPEALGNDKQQNFIGNGVVVDPTAMGELVAEVHAHVLRARKNFAKPPETGRCAVASFSNGANFLRQFLAHTTSGFLKDTVREIYMFDPPSQEMGVLANAKKVYEAWPTGEGAVRFYGKFGFHPPHAKDAIYTNMHEVLNAGVPTTGTSWDHDVGHAGARPDGFNPAYVALAAFDDTYDGGGACDGRPDRTFAFLPFSAWPVAPIQGLTMHSWIPSTMLAHALRHSGF